jgi:hypothetical protein
MIKPRLRLLDTAALALHYGVAVGTIRRWASEDRWHPYGTRRHRQWDMAAARRSWEKRHPDGS